MLAAKAAATVREAAEAAAAAGQEAGSAAAAVSRRCNSRRKRIPTWSSCCKSSRLRGAQHFARIDMSARCSRCRTPGRLEGEPEAARQPAAARAAK